MPELHRKIADLKRDAFLKRIADLSRGDPSRWVPVGSLGQEMGLAYEEALRITAELREAGWVSPSGAGRLDPPYGPRVHILPEGMVHLREASSPPH